MVRTVPKGIGSKSDNLYQRGLRGGLLFFLILLNFIVQHAAGARGEIRIWARTDVSSSHVWWYLFFDWQLFYVGFLLLFAVANKLYWRKENNMVTLIGVHVWLIVLFASILKRLCLPCVWKISPFFTFTGWKLQPLGAWWWWRSDPFRWQPSRNGFWRSSL